MHTVQRRGRDGAIDSPLPKYYRVKEALLDPALASPLLLLDSAAYPLDGRAFEYSQARHRGAVHASKWSFSRRRTMLKTTALWRGGDQAQAAPG